MEWISQFLSSLGAELINWDQLEDESPNRGEGSEGHADSPLADSHSVTRDIEDSTSQVTNNELDACNCKDNEGKEPILGNSSKDILLIMDLSCIDEVEYLTEDEGIEDETVVARRSNLLKRMLTFDF